MACLFDADSDGYGSWEGRNGNVRLNLAQEYERATTAGQSPPDSVSSCATYANGLPLRWLLISPTETFDDDQDACIRPSVDIYGNVGRQDVCIDGDDDQGDDDASDDDDDDADDDDQAGDDDDDDSTPDVEDPDNGEEDVTICWDADQASTWGNINALSLNNAVVGEIYVFNHPDSGWFNDEDGIDLDVEGGSRWCFQLQCGWDHLVNGEVNGSEIGSPNQQFIAHNAPNSSTPRLWGRFETEGGDQLPQELQDNGAGYGADVWVTAPDCD